MRIGRRTRHRELAALALLSVLAATGCRARTAPTPERPSVSLSIRNEGYYDVSVHVLRSGSAAAFRLGMVDGFSSRTLRVPRNELQLGDELVLRLHAIGTSQTWESPALLVGSDLLAHLEIHTDANGDLRRSFLFNSIAAAE